MLPSTICSFIRRTICENKRILHTLQDASKFNSRQSNLCLNYSHKGQNFKPMIFKRFKSRKQTEDYATETEDYESESEDELLDDSLDTRHVKIIQTTVPSLRLDAVLKAGLGISRAKVDQEFFKSNIRINEEKCLKKNMLVEVDDQIDLIVGRSPQNDQFLIVHRCILLSVHLHSNKIYVKLARNKSLLIEDYEEPWTGVSS